MSSFFRQWISAILCVKSETNPSQDVDETDSVDLSTPVAEAADAARRALIRVGARRPVISNTGAVVGYEFCLPANVIARLNLSSEQRVKSAYIATVMTSASLVETSGKIGFARIQTHWLDPEMSFPDCSGVWVCMESPQSPKTGDVNLERVAEFVKRLRSAGAKVGWSATFVEMGKSSFELVPDFVLLLQGDAPISALLTARQTWPESLRSLPTLATDLCSEEDLEAALLGGISYVCGAFHRNTATPQTSLQRAVQPEVIRLVKLMNLLISDAELPTVVNDIKGDVGLSYRLLSMMKSAKYANYAEGLTIEQAVLALGRDELYRTLSVMLLRYTGTRRVSSALEEIALWRSRLLELLAIDKGEPMPGHFFTMGLVSMLGCILKQELADVVEKFSLAEPAKQALLTKDGPWSAYLRVAMEVEQQKLDATSLNLEEFGGSDRIIALSEMAWDWAVEQSKR